MEPMGSLMKSGSKQRPKDPDPGTQAPGPETGDSELSLYNRFLDFGVLGVGGLRVCGFCGLWV